MVATMTIEHLVTANVKPRKGAANGLSAFQLIFVLCRETWPRTRPPDLHDAESTAT